MKDAFTDRREQVEREARKADALAEWEAREPAWHAEALCRSDQLPGGRGPQRPGAAWDVNDDAFTDEEGIPEVIRDFVEVCSSCPVRKPCLEAAIVFESAIIDVGSVYHYVSHEPECKIKDNPDCEGCVPEESRLRRKRLLIKPQPRDIYGGIPARVRAKLSMSPCPTCSGTGDVGHFMLAGIDVKPLAAEFHKERKGWPCDTCKGEGRVPNPHMAADCNAWLAEQAKRYGWHLGTREVVA